MTFYLGNLVFAFRHDITGRIIELTNTNGDPTDAAIAGFAIIEDEAGEAYGFDLEDLENLD